LKFQLQVTEAHQFDQSSCFLSSWGFASSDKHQHIPVWCMLSASRRILYWSCISCF